MLKTGAVVAFACFLQGTAAVAQTQPEHTQHHAQDAQAQGGQSQSGQKQPDTRMSGGQMQSGQMPMTMMCPMMAQMTMGVPVQGGQTSGSGQGGQTPMMVVMPMICPMMAQMSMMGGQMQQGAQLPMQTGKTPMQTGQMPMQTGQMPMQTGQMPMTMNMMPGRAPSEADRGYVQAMHKMHQSMTTMQMTGDATGDFVRMMIPHHQSAIDMSKVLLQEKDVDPEIKAMAEKIIADQQKEIETFQRWLEMHKQ
jgi:uncharacterized protein (DUF305 family)